MRRFQTYSPRSALSNLAFGRDRGADAPETFNCDGRVEGQYRIQNNDAEGFLLYVGVNALPNFDQPANAFSVTLPLTLAWPLPGSEIVTLNVVARYRDSYGLISKNSYPTVIRLSPSGEVLLTIPIPVSVYAFPRANGNIKVMASYPTRGFERDPADKMKIWVATSGVPNVNVGADYVQSITNDIVVAEFGTYTPGTYNIAVAFFRTVDSALSTPVYMTVTFPELPGPLEAVLTDNITP